MWLSTRDLPLRVESKKLTQRFVGPFPIQRIISLTAVRLQLPRTMWVYPTFHVSKVNPVYESPLVPACLPPPPLRLIKGGSAFTVRFAAFDVGGGYSTWLSGRNTVQRIGLRFLSVCWTPSFQHFPPAAPDQNAINSTRRSTCPGPQAGDQPTEGGVGWRGEARSCQTLS